MATAIDGPYRRTAAPPRIMGPRARRRYAVANVTFGFFLWLVLIGTAPLQEWAFRSAIGAGDTINQVLYIGILLVLLLASGMPSRGELFCLPTALTVLLAYCFVSVLWAIAPLISLRRITQTAIAIWVTFRLVNDLGPARALRMLRVAMAALLVINFLVVFFTPYGVHSEVFGEASSVVGDWRGIIPHKNVTGAACSLTILLFLFDNRQFPKIVSALVIAGSIVFLYYTNSRTSEVILVPAIALGYAIRPYSANYRTTLVIILLIIAALLLEALSANIRFLADIFNDPGSLTGRGAIWPLLIEYASEHPWTGAGFGSFWLIGDDSPIWTLTTGWVAIYAPHGHNGFLDLLVTIGVPGLVLAIVALAIWPLLRLLLSLSINKSRRSLLLALITFCLGHNLTESSLLNGAALVQVFLTLTIALIYRESNASAGSHHLLRQRFSRMMRKSRRQRAW